MKRIISSILALTMMFALSCGATAVSGGASPMASPTLAEYIAIMTAGTSSRELKIAYDVTASRLADLVGVSSIVIYKSDGSYVTTITGTTGNGLIVSSDFGHAGSYAYLGTSGTYYYAKVTVFATIGSVSDSRTITTSTVKAP